MNGGRGEGKGFWDIFLVFFFCEEGGSLSNLININAIENHCSMLFLGYHGEN